MKAATVERDEAVAQGPSTRIYLACRQNLILVHTPVYDINASNGRKTGETKGMRLYFNEGRFDCPLEGEYRFANGETMPADELREWLDGHALNGDAAEGFWQVDPSAPAPSADELQSIVDRAMELDLDGLERMLAAEAQGWQREPVLVMARRAIEKVLEVRGEQAAEAAAVPPVVDPHAAELAAAVAAAVAAAEENGAVTERIVAAEAEKPRGRRAAPKATE